MAKDSPIQFKGTALKIIHAFAGSADPAVLHEALGELTGNAPDFFENELAVLDFTQAEALPDTVDWAALRALFAGSGLQAVATLGLPPALAAEAAAAGLPAVAPDALSRMSRPLRASEAPPADAPAQAAPEVAPEADAAPAPAAVPVAPVPAARPTLLIDKPLRSGQRIYAPDSDLIITAMVSAGAEVIADGHIHVYAPLRGRALAGARGDKSARIFTTCLEAELVSVAGLYRTFESGVPDALARQPATVSFDQAAEGGRLVVAPLALR